jgi:hypothetical protein
MMWVPNSFPMIEHMCMERKMASEVGTLWVSRALSIVLQSHGEGSECIPSLQYAMSCILLWVHPGKQAQPNLPARTQTY